MNVKINHANSGKLHRLFWLIALSIGFALCLPKLLAKGMFMDGVTYAAISRNLAQGKGTFWAPFYTETIYPVFYEHPPLVFGIQSIFFRILGDHYLVEKLYSFLSGIMAAYLIHRIWVTCAPISKNSSWLPILLWITIPVVNLSYTANMLENTLTIFSLMGTIILLSGFKEGNRKISNYLLAGLCVIAATLCKGPIGLFLLALPGIYWATLQTIRFRAAVIATLTLIGTIVISYLVLIISTPKVKNYFAGYMNNQILAGLRGEREKFNRPRWYIIENLVTEQLLILIILTVTFLVFIYLTKGTSIIKKYGRQALFFGLMGLTASVPIVISAKQTAYYAVPAMPFFALAFGFLFLPAIQKMIEKGIPRELFITVRISAYVLFLSVVVYSFLQVNKYDREEKLIKSVECISSVIPENTIVSTDFAPEANFAMVAYFYRIHKISLDNRNLDRTWFLSLNKSTPQGYKEKTKVSCIPFSLSKKIE